MFDFMLIDLKIHNVVVPRGKSETLSTSDSIQRPSEVFQD
jgi:hypothetical protein